MGFNINIPQGNKRFHEEDDYHRNIKKAQDARNNQRRDTDPGMQKEGYLGMDELDYLRRCNLKKIY